MSLPPIAIDPNLPVQGRESDRPTSPEQIPDAVAPGYVIEYRGHRFSLGVCHLSFCELWVCKKVSAVCRRIFCCKSSSCCRSERVESAKRSPDPSEGDGKRRFSAEALLDRSTHSDSLSHRPTSRTGHYPEASSNIYHDED